MAERPLSPLTRARRSLELIAEVTRGYESQTPGVREMAVAMATPGFDGRASSSILARYPVFDYRHPFYSDAMAQARDSAIYRQWARTRVVYAPDADLMEDLAETDDTPVPLSILTRLPHPDPYLLLPMLDPEGMGSRRYAGVGIPWGVFVYGQRDINAYGHILRSTTAEDVDSFGLMFTGVAAAEDGPHTQTLRVTLPVGGSRTVAEIAEHAVTRFHFGPALPVDRREDLIAWLKFWIPQVLNVLLYVCSDDTDVETENLARKAKKNKAARPRPSDVHRLVKVGWRLGPALAAERRRAERAAAEESERTGRTVRPHRRRAHRHLYWTGQGRSVPRIKWLKGTWVHKDKLLAGDPEPETTVVHPVRRKAAK